MDRLARAMTFALVAPTLCASAAPARAADEGPWLSSDSAMHFAASAGISAGGYGLGAVIFGDRARAALLGAGAGAAAGVGKELLDAAGHGDPSWGDLAWDGLGVVTGLALALAIDVLVRGLEPRPASPAAPVAPAQPAAPAQPVAPSSF